LLTNSGYNFANWLKLLAAVVLIAWISTRIDFAQLKLVISGVSPLYLVIVILLLIPNLGFQFYKWNCLVKTQIPDVSPRIVFRSMMLGFTLGIITPGRLGEHARIACFKDSCRTSLTTLSLLDKLSSSIITTIFGVAALFFIPKWDLSIFGELAPLLTITLMCYGSAIALFSLASLVLLLAPGRVADFIALLPWISRYKTFQKIHTGLNLIHPAARLKLLTGAAAFYATFILQFVLLVEGLGFSHRLSWTAASGTMFLKSLFPISLGDLGVRELFASNLYESLGAASELAISAAFLLFIINVLFPALLGTLFISKKTQG
jgi:hypothetical protein